MGPYPIQQSETAAPAPQQPPAQPQVPSFEELAQKSSQAFDRKWEQAQADRRQSLKEKDEIFQRATAAGPLAKFFMSDADWNTRSQLLRQWAESKSREAQQPIENAISEHIQRGEDLKQAQARGQLQMQDMATRMEWDPNTPEAAAARQVLRRAGIDVPENTSMGHVRTIFEKMPTLAKGFSDLASAAKAQAEAKAVPITTASEAGLRAQQAREAGARAGVEEMKIGRGPAPGWVRTGDVPYSEANDAEHQKDVASAEIITRDANEVLQKLGDKNFLTSLQNPSVAADIGVRMKDLAGEMRNHMAARGFPDSMINFITEEIGKPDKWTASNIAQLSANRKRLQTLKEVTNENLRTRAKARGFAPGAQPVSTKTKPQLFKRKDGSIVELQADGTYAPKTDARTATR